MKEPAIGKPLVKLYSKLIGVYSRVFCQPLVVVSYPKNLTGIRNGHVLRKYLTYRTDHLDPAPRSAQARAPQ